MKIIALLLALASVACRGSMDSAARGAPVKPSITKSAAPDKVTPAPAKSVEETEREDLQRLVAGVTAADRAQFQKETDAIWAAYEKAAPKPRVLFEIPAAECCTGGGKPNECEDQHRTFRGLCYDNPDREAWGLGPLTIDDAGVFWIYDAAVSRIVGFDKSGKFVAAYSALNTTAHSLVATPTEFWLDKFNPMEDPSMPNYLVRVDRGTGSTRDYQWKDVIGQAHQGFGWQMPDTPSRIVRWHAEWSWNVVDVVFLDDHRIQVSPPHPLHVRGHRYYLDCDINDKKSATLVIDDHATPAFGCTQLEYVGPEGDTIAGAPFLHYDVHGKLIGMAVREQPPFYVLKDGRDSAVGPDGKVYQYVTHKHSVQFVELPLHPR